MKARTPQKRWVILPVLLLLGIPPASAQDTETRTPLPPDELAELLAPIALYPDALLFQVLAAAQHPLDVVRAERWIQTHAHLTGEDAVQAASDENWDPSVQALAAFPRILAQMSEKLEWTERLGAAMREQEEQVLDAVQRLRQKAYAAGHLESTDYVRVHREGPRIILGPAHLHSSPYTHIRRHPGREAPEEFWRRSGPDRSRSSGDTWGRTWNRPGSSTWDRTWDRPGSSTWDRTWDRPGDRTWD